MDARRTYTILKRRRQVFIQKLWIMFFVCILTLGISIMISDNSVDAHTVSAEKETSLYKYYTSIEVSPGDTLWSIAQKYAHESDETVRDYVKELKAINGLDSNNIQDGQYLTISYLGPSKGTGQEK